MSPTPCESRTITTLCTAPAPGAIAIVQLSGPEALRIARQLTDVAATGRVRLADLGGIDEGLVAALSERWVQIMPHGGVRVVQQVLKRLSELGAVVAEEEADARSVYPEAATELEAGMLWTLAQAGSPAAIDVLLNQPRRWREAVERGEIDAGAVLRRSATLDRLVHPPTVVVVGPPNVGKSTLANLVLGRTASITADLPGTTRDWVAGLGELTTPVGELTVRWFDTPGLREAADAIERRAMELAERVVAGADVLIAATDPLSDWVEAARLRREPDVRLMTKRDLLRGEALATRVHRGVRWDVAVSGATGEGLEDLAGAVARVLGLGAEDRGELWAFCAGLRRRVEAGDMRGLGVYALGERFADDRGQG